MYTAYGKIHLKYIHFDDIIIKSSYWFFGIGSGAFPDSATTNLHIDMSDAINTMVCIISSSTM